MTGHLCWIPVQMGVMHDARIAIIGSGSLTGIEIGSAAVTGTRGGFGFQRKAGLVLAN